MGEVSRVGRVQIAGTLLAGTDDWVVSTRSDWRDGARVSESASQEKVLLYLAARVWLKESEDKEPCFYLVPLTSIGNGEKPLEEEVEAWVAPRFGARSVVRGMVKLEKRLLYEGRCGCRPAGDSTYVKVEHGQECVRAQRMMLKEERANSGR